MATATNALDKESALKSLAASGNLLEEITKGLAVQCTVKGGISVGKMDENQYVFYQLSWMTAQQKLQSILFLMLGILLSELVNSNKKWQSCLQQKLFPLSALN